jgi:hypothetical protein
MVDVARPPRCSTAQYRLRADNYNTLKQPAYIIEGDLPPLTPKQLEILARQNFVQTCSDIYSFAISTEVAKGGALQMGPFGKYQVRTRWVSRALAGGSAPRAPMLWRSEHEHHEHERRARWCEPGAQPHM